MNVACHLFDDTSARSFLRISNALLTIQLFSHNICCNNGPPNLLLQKHRSAFSRDFIFVSYSYSDVFTPFRQVFPVQIWLFGPYSDTLRICQCHYIILWVLPKSHFANLPTHLFFWLIRLTNCIWPLNSIIVCATKNVLIIFLRFSVLWTIFYFSVTDSHFHNVSIVHATYSSNGLNTFCTVLPFVPIWYYKKSFFFLGNSFSLIDASASY